MNKKNTKTELKILEYLEQNKEQIFSVKEIHEKMNFKNIKTVYNAINFLINNGQVIFCMTRKNNNGKTPTLIFKHLNN